MADERETPPPPTAKPWLSSLCPNDLGLKAGFWSGKNEDAVRFRPIVGSLVVTNFVQGTALGPFLPVVLSDLAFPTIVAGDAFPDYIGVFANALTAEEARAKFEQWRKKPGPADGPGTQSQPLN
jgi:hypothetical protein